MAVSFGPMPAEIGSTSEDAVLGGRLTLRQPLRGHRFGHDAFLLAAAVPARPGEHAIDLGSGVGAAGLALARRVEGVTVTLVEIDPALAALAAENARRNGLADRAHALCLDAGSGHAAFAAAGLEPATVEHVLMNPPFNPPHNPSPERDRRSAHRAETGTLQRWLFTAARLLRAGGAVTLIWRADGLGEVLASLAPSFGAVAILPIYPKPDAPAIRILVRAVSGSRGPLTLLPGLVLADSAGKPTAAAEAVLRDAAALSLTA
jgi:tRNA1(Val) A37 N6-methylase TrmN6